MPIPWDDSGSVSDSQRVDAEPPALLALLQRLERMPESSVGALCFERTPGTPEATILIEHGRVCWAVLAGSRRRLRELLVQRPDGPSDAHVEATVRECRDSGSPLGETLVRRGLVSESVLREALREHTCEALRHIASARGLRARWITHQRARYDAQFSFTALELLVECGRQLAPIARVRAAGAALAQLSGIAHASLVFDPDSRSPGIPLASAGDLACPTDDVARLARGAMTCLAALAVPGDGVRAALLRADDDAAVIGWWWDELVVLSFVTSRRDVVLALSRLGGREEKH